MFANMTAGVYRQETGQGRALSKSESAGLRQRPAPRRIHFGVLQLQVHMTLTRLPLAPDGSNTLSNVTGNQIRGCECDFTFGSAEVNNEKLYRPCFSVDFRRLQALRIQTLDIHGDRGDL
jgi:hypothetical protein